MKAQKQDWEKIFDKLFPIDSFDFSEKSDKIKEFIRGNRQIAYFEGLRKGLEEEFKKGKAETYRRGYEDGIQKAHKISKDAKVNIL